MSLDGPRATDGFSRQVLRALRRRLLTIIVLPLLAAGAAFALSSTQPDEYEATATLLLRDRQLSQIVAGFSPPYRDPTREAQTNLDLVRSGAVERRVLDSLPPSGRPDDLDGIVTIAEQGGSDLVGITARHGFPEYAALLANTWAAEYIAFRQEADRSQILESIEVIERRLSALSADQSAGPEGVRLREQRNELEVLASLQTGNAELVDPAAVPTSRVAPRPLRTAIIAWLVCLMAVVVGASLLERYDRRLSSIADMEAAFGLSVLGDIPQSRALSWTGEDSGQAPPGPREREAFRSLRTNLRYLTLDSDLRTILITSAASRQGKTTVAIHLAQAFADGGAKVLLVEGDLRRPTLRRRLKLGASTTLVGAVIDRVPLRNAVTLPLPQDATRYTADAQETTPRRPGAVDVLPAGEAPTNPVQVLESRAFSELIDEARSRYDLVIIDGPPVLGLGDFAPLSRLADGAVFVARLDSTTTAQASALSQQVRLVGANVLGLVVNGTRGAGPDYLYLSAQADQPRKSAV